MIAGCATQFGRVVDAPVHIRLMSQPLGMTYYILTILENDQIDGEVERINKSKSILAFLDKKAPLSTDQYRHRRKKGDFIIMFDCGSFYNRIKIHFDEGVVQDLSCK